MFRITCRHLSTDLFCSFEVSFTLEVSSSTESQDQVQVGVLLDVVIPDCEVILQLLAGEDEPLLVNGDTFSFLNKEKGKE